MIADMPRKNLPHLRSERNRHGTIVHYVRVGNGRRTRLRAPWGSPEFDAQYHAAIAGKPLTARQTRSATAGTLAWAIKLYMASAAWRDLADATRRQRGNILKKIVADAGGARLIDIDRKHIIDGRERRSATPAAARHFIETLRAFFQWAIDADLTKADPTRDVKAPKKTGTGFPTWTQEEADAFRAHWPIGTRERLAFEIFDGTGLRISDAAVFGRQHVKDGDGSRVGSLVTIKTGERVWFPLGAMLEEAIAACPSGGLTFVETARGTPFRKESLGNWMRPAIRAAGVLKSPHGIRKLAATRDSEAGWSDRELEAKYGWRGGRMAEKYTDAANRQKLALGAAARTKPAAAPLESAARGGK